MNAVAFAPDGRTLATAGTDRTLNLWDLTDPGAPARLGEPLIGHSGPVDAVAFAPDGPVLATGNWDGTVILWDLTDPGAPARLGEPLIGHSGRVYAVAFAPDGRTLATGGIDDRLILWELTDLTIVRGHPSEQACRITGRGLDRSEWARYIPGLPYRDTCPANRTAVQE